MIINKSEFFRAVWEGNCYTCPNCSYASIQEMYRYCPSCGNAVEFVGTSENIDIEIIALSADFLQNISDKNEALKILGVGIDR